MKDLAGILQDLDMEIVRSKQFVNENGYHNGTAINVIVRRYREELKAYRKIVSDDLHMDHIGNYAEVEDQNPI